MRNIEDPFRVDGLGNGRHNEGAARRAENLEDGEELIEARSGEFRRLSGRGRAPNVPVSRRPFR